LSEKIGQLKLKAKDWKYYLTDVANTETILRLIQSTPSKKAEPFKLWLAKVWNERINEIHDSSQHITLEELEKSIKKKAHTKWKELRELLLKSKEIRWKCKDENYTEFWEIAYKDLPETTKKTLANFYDIKFVEI
jgi:hypothetical protein